MKDKKTKKNGSVLIFSMIMLALILMSALAIGAATVIERKNTLTSNKSTQGFQIADTGVEIVAKKIREASSSQSISSAWTCLGGNNAYISGTSLGVAPGNADIKLFTDADGMTPAICASSTIGDIRTLKAVGTFSATTRAVQAPIRNHQAAVMDSGPAGYWKMDGNANDAAGANNGVATNVTYLSTSGNFKFGSAAGDFNGASSFVTIGNPPALSGMSQLSVEIWTKFDSLAGASNYVPFGKEGVYRFYIDNGGAVRFSVRTTNNAWNGSGTYAYLSSGTIQTGRWYQFVGTYDGQNVKLYVDGVLVAQGSQAISGDIFTNLNPVAIGYSGTSSFFDGKIDEVAIYSRALSQPEIQAHR